LPDEAVLADPAVGIDERRHDTGTHLNTVVWLEKPLDFVFGCATTTQHAVERLRCARLVCDRKQFALFGLVPRQKNAALAVELLGCRRGVFDPDRRPTTDGCGAARETAGRGR